MSNKEKLIEAIAKTFNKDIGEIHDETRFKEDLLAKSTHYFTLIAVLESLSDKSTTYAKIRKCTTVAEMYDFLGQLMNS